LLQRLRPKQRDVNANSGAIWQSLGTYVDVTAWSFVGAQYAI